MASVLHLKQVRLCGALQQKYQVLSMIRERMTGGKTGIAAKPEKAGKNEGGRVVPAAAFSLE